MKEILLVLAATCAGAPILDFGTEARPAAASPSAAASEPVPGSFDRATTRISDILAGRTSPAARSSAVSQPSAVSDRARIAPVVPPARTSTLPRPSTSVRAAAARPAPIRADPAPVRVGTPPRPSSADLPGEREALARVEADLFEAAVSPPAPVPAPAPASAPTASPPVAGPPTSEEAVASQRAFLGTARQMLPAEAAPAAEPSSPPRAGVSRDGWRAPRPPERPATGWIGLGLVAFGGAGFFVWSRLRRRPEPHAAEAPRRNDLQDLVRTARRIPPPGTLFDRTVTEGRRLSPIGFHSEVERRIASRSLRDEGDFEEEREEIEAARTLLERGVSPRVVRETTGARASEVKLLASLEKHVRRGDAGRPDGFSAFE